jgi:hypothetical protein
LICRFCSQWNPEGTNRCCFCGNPLDATEDRTLSGAPDYLRNTGQQLQVPKAMRSRFDTPPEGGFDLMEKLRSGSGSDRLIGVLVVAGVALMVLYGMWRIVCR